MPDARVLAMPPKVASAPGSTGKKQPRVAQALNQHLPLYAGFDIAIHVLGIHTQNPIHLREIECEPAIRCVEVAFEGCPRAKGDDWHALLRAELHDADNLIG